MSEMTLKEAAKVVLQIAENQPSEERAKLEKIGALLKAGDLVASAQVQGNAPQTIGVRDSVTGVNAVLIDEFTPDGMPVYQLTPDTRLYPAADLDALIDRAGVAADRVDPVDPSQTLGQAYGVEPGAADGGDAATA